MSFLMVGHTHEDIDQVFSRVSAHLKKNSVYTIDGMINFLVCLNNKLLNVDVVYM